MELEAFVRGLVEGSRGIFKPDALEKLRRQEKPSPTSTEDVFGSRVSVVCPTTDSRHEFHEQLWAVFDAQTWPDKELVVVETYTTRPSPFFMEKQKTDERIVHVAYKVDVDRDLSIGLKRNLCTFLASGTFLANFDDDDLYAPCYLDVMMRGLVDQKSEGVTLSTYYVYDVRSGMFGWCDQRYASESARYGYGFSYVFLRWAALCHPYPNQNMGEDFGFFNTLRKRMTSTVFGGQRHVALHVDECGICCHTLHPKATSNTYAKRQVPLDEVLGLDIGELDILDAYTKRFPLTHGASRYIGKTARRQQKVTVHTSLGDLQFSPLVGDPMSTLQEQLHAELQCGGSPGAFLFYTRCPSCLLREGEESWEEGGEPAPLGPSARVGPRRAELWATLPAERNEEPGVEVVIKDLRNHDVSVSVWVHAICKLDAVVQAFMRDHGSHTAAVSKLGRQLRLARLKAQALGQLESYFEACKLSEWLLDKRELYMHGLQHFLDQVAVERTGELPVVQLHLEGENFHFRLVEVPPPVTARELRGLVGSLLPVTAQLFPGRLASCKGVEAIDEEARLPDVITTDRFDGNMSESIFGTRDMAIRAQKQCISLLSKEDVQGLFDELEAASGGNRNEYRKTVHGVLPDKVYRPLLERFHLPVDRGGVMVFSSSVQAHFTPLDLDMCSNWLAIEMLMRNQTGIKAAEGAIAKIHTLLAASH